jgi:nucleoside-diphosphate-sugar epimerase
VAIERTLLDGPLRTTIVRPGAIHGPGARLAREWFFVKRALDGRRLVCLAHRGHSRFHTTSVGNLAELIRLAAHRPSNRILNCGDPEPPSVLEISRAVAAAMEHEWTELLLAGAAAGDVGDHPWNVPRPFVLDTVEAEIELGYRPVTTYARAVPETCRWLVEATRDRDWRDVLPPTAEHLASSFDYAAEDAFVAGLSGQARPG